MMTVRSERGKNLTSDFPVYSIFDDYFVSAEMCSYVCNKYIQLPECELNFGGRCKIIRISNTF